MQLLISRFFVFCFATLIATSSFASLGDADVVKARAAYKKKDAATLFEYTSKLKAQHHILAPYAQYWLMALNIDEVSNQAIADFLTQHEAYAFAKILRGKFLKKLGKSQNWPLLMQQYTLYQSTKNTGIECLAAEAAHAQKQVSLSEAKHLWLTGRNQPQACNRLFDKMDLTGVLDEDAVWQRFRMVTARGRVRLAKSIIKRSAGYQSGQQQLVVSAHKTPTGFLEKRKASFSTRFGHEVNLFALVRLAKIDTWRALSAYKANAHFFSHEEKSYFNAMLGQFAAKRHEPEAHLWFQKADAASLNHEQISWYARAALRQSNWAQLLTVIARMKPEIAEEARWRYWKARALNALNQDKTQANTLLQTLAVERHYYGWMAQDELENYVPPVLAHYDAPISDVAAMSALPGVQRTAALLNAEIRYQAKLEWKQVIADFDDKQLLAAAAYAKQQGWNDLAINTADDTRGVHNFSLRYLMPYKILMTNAANEQGVDVTWVHGITRQESRFVHYAKSHVGAAGLMQLMPKTAKWAAKKAGVYHYKRSMIHDLDTNVTIGTYYLRYALDTMSGNTIMATAGYNAGPSRAKKWLGPQALEGAIYAETIPFNETRVYVQRVMANMYMYGKQVGVKGVTLKQLMSTTPAIKSNDR